MRRQRVRRPTSWELLAVGLVVLAGVCVTLVVTVPDRPPERPEDLAVRVLLEDVNRGPSRESLREQLRVDAEKLRDAGVLLQAQLRAGDEVLVDVRGKPRAGYRAGTEVTRIEVGRSGTYVVTAVPAVPADLAELRERNLLVLGLVLSMLAVTAVALVVSRRRHAEQQRMALVDPLTGVGNRRQLDRLAVRLLRDCADGRRHGLLLLDLDGFKQLNDRYGHERGDQVLRRLAEGLQEVVRPHDHVVRLGGDEFAVLLEDLPAGPEGEVVLRRVLHRLRKSLPDLGISGGWAVWPDDGRDLTVLSRVADRGMYADKQRRRSIDLRDRPEGTTRRQPAAASHG